MKHLGREINNGIVEDSYFDSSTNQMHTRTSMDLSSLFERNLYERNNGNNGFTTEGDMRKIAELDMVTVMRLKSEFNIDVFNNDDTPRLKKWLKENNKFMTVNGGI